MRLLLLIPNLLLLAISGYNLANDFTVQGDPHYLTFKILHVLVMAMCITFISLIVRSLLRVTAIAETESSVETDENYEELNLQHS
ncbi:MAG: hypothetical protein EOO45_04815 [Flavobacterium sp.]|nr:MAG: hypothetical protein EOO45_04815 [Flavobacterium sp.]